jgi:ribokinase
MSLVSHMFVAVLGDINIDVLLPVEVYPQPGGEALARQVWTSLGGSAANTAVVLARLGCRVRLIARIGNDLWGEMALRALAKLDVGTEAIQRDERAATGMMFMPITPDGERTMFGHRGANAHTDPDLVTEQMMNGCAWLHLSGYALLEPPQRDAAQRALELAHKLALPISLDTAYLPALTAPQELKPLINRLALCILGLEEAEALTGEREPEGAIKALISMGVEWVGLKIGSRGCLVGDHQGVWVIPPFPAQVMDATGAGDAFSAGLIFGYLNRISLPAAGVLANALGALAVQVLGAGSALPERDEVRKLLGSHLGRVDTPFSDWIAEALRVI